MGKDKGIDSDFKGSGSDMDIDSVMDTDFIDIVMDKAPASTVATTRTSLASALTPPLAGHGQ